MSDLLNEIAARNAEIVEEQRLMDEEERERFALEVRCREISAKRYQRKDKIKTLQSVVNHQNVLVAVGQEVFKATQKTSEAEVVHTKANELLASLEAEREKTNDTMKALAVEREKTVAMQEELASLLAKTKEEPGT